LRYDSPERDAEAIETAFTALMIACSVDPLGGQRFEER
jgi:hypothetical protein